MLSEEAAAGNYVIAGGGWNHALCGSLEMYESQQQVPPWVSTLDESELPSGLLGRAGRQHRGRCNLSGGVDIPYEEGFTYRVAVDGFIVSDNVTATAENINAGFTYSDNNPVKLTFTLAAQ